MLKRSTMNTSEQLNYDRIAQAIDYVRNNFKKQPSLERIAKSVHVSPFHFQRLFTEWAGTSPKNFLQYISIEYAKKLLKEQNATLFDTAEETGLSGTGRLHDLFIKIEGMTPAEYKNGGQDLEINYSYADSPFGDIIIASTRKGICHLAFFEDRETALSKLKSNFPNASFLQMTDSLQQNALLTFQTDPGKPEQVKLHLKGTQFQLKVWNALLKIPQGGLATYGNVSAAIHQPNASRAVGTAIGSNPVAYLIPCHRVIQSTGNFGNYMWGSTRKTAIIGWEASKVNAGSAEKTTYHRK